MFQILELFGRFIFVVSLIAMLLAAAGAVLSFVAGQWALGVPLAVLAVGAGVITFKLWQASQPA